MSDLAPPSVFGSGPAGGGPASGGSCGGSFPAGPGGAEAVGVGAGADDVGVEGEAVNDGRCEPGVGEGLAPFNWDWHMFVWAQMRCELLILACGVSAGFRGGSAVC